MRKGWTLAGAAAVAVAVAVHFVAGGVQSPEAQVVRGVRVRHGLLSGLLKTTEDGFSYLSFLGVPYAEPPVGELRFKPPRDARPWSGEFQATKDGPMCTQVKDKKFKARGLLGLNGTLADLVLLLTSIPRFIRMLMSVEESEDCLYLNVFTPAKRLPTVELRPVLLFIHGGGFVRGSKHSAIYGPDYLIDRDMVVVTFNYRLGAFGFLATNTSDAPGNAGLWDQNLAMKWVRDNIRSFGGDPNRVTLYGESAGSASVHLHVLSPASKGLFHAAIMSSSSALSMYVVTENPAEHSALLARSLGADEATVADPAARVRYIRIKDRAQVVASFADCLTAEDARQVITKLPFGPVVEYCEDGADHFLCERPEVLLREGRYNKVPMIFGLNQHEGTLIHALDSVPEVVNKISSDVTTLVPRNLYPRMSEAERRAVGLRIQQQYIDPRSPNDTLPLMNLYGDMMLTHGVHVAIKWHTKHSTPATPVYVYHFTKDVFGFYKFIYGIRTLKGPGHADELGCVFNIYIFNRKYYPDRDIIDVGTKQMTDIISSFVHSRRPVSATSRYLNIPWPPTSPTAMQYLEFGESLEIKTDLLKDRMQFWDSVYGQVTHNPIYN